MSGHEAFLERFGIYIGKPLKLLLDQFSENNGYHTITRKLNNGNYEVEIANPVPRSVCRVFYAYNSSTENIVSWHYTGGNHFGGCYVNPN